MKIIAFFVALLVSTSAFGGISVSPPISAGGIAAAGGVTNGAPFFIKNYSTTNYPYSPLTVSGCTLFPWLNSTNWRFQTNMGAYVMNVTNFLFQDTSGNALGWVFGNTNFSSDGVTGIFEADSASQITLRTPTLVTSWIRVSDAASDTTIVSYGGAAMVNTNIYSDSSGLTWLTVPSAKISNPNGQAINILEGGGHDLIHLSYNSANDMGANGQIDFFGYLGAGPANQNGNQSGKINYHALGKGLLPNDGGTGIGDDRVGASVGFFFGNSGEYGSTLEFLTVGSSNYNQGAFNRALVLDPIGGVTAAYPNMSGHGMSNSAAGRFDVWPTALMNQPTMVLHAGNLSTNKFVGAIECDSTNFWMTTTNLSNGTNRMPVLAGSAQTNTILPLIPLAGSIQIGYGGIGGTNMYLVFKDSTGANRTNKVMVTPGYP